MATPARATRHLFPHYLGSGRKFADDSNRPYFLIVNKDLKIRSSSKYNSSKGPPADSLLTLFRPGRAGA
jgi:hypothetical protein